MYLDISLEFIIVLVSAIVISSSQSFALSIIRKREIGLLQNKVPCSAPMRPGTTAVPSCNLNYKPDRSTFSMMICLRNGTWDESLFTCLPVCGVSHEAVEVQPLITYGQEAHIGLFPWHAGVYYRKQYNNNTVYWDQGCGGSLITERFVLTAAHCVHNKKEENIRIALGKYYRSWGQYEPTEEKRRVSQIFYPEEYRSHTFSFDLGLLALDRIIMFNDYIMPVCHGYVGISSNIEDKPLFIVGWGKTTTGRQSDILQYKEVSILDKQVCFKKFPSYYSDFEKFCIGSNNSAMSVAQVGDSGGALTVVQDGLHYIIGIVSVRFDKYSFLTNVSWHYDLKWIENQIKSNSSTFRWIENEVVTINNTLDQICRRQGDNVWCERVRRKYTAEQRAENEKLIAECDVCFNNHPLLSCVKCEGTDYVSCNGVELNPKRCRLIRGPGGYVAPGIRD